jgi:polyferredoxin
MDACDAVMTRIGKPMGLIRYSSRDELEGRPTSLLRPRVVLYPLALAVTMGLLLWGLGARAAPDVTLMRGIGAPYTLEPDGGVVNQVRIKVTNRGRQSRAVRIELAEPEGASLIAPQNPLLVPAGRSQTTSVFVVAPAAGFAHGERSVAFRLSDGVRWGREFPYRLVGPVPRADGTHPEHERDEEHGPERGEEP